MKLACLCFETSLSLVNSEAREGRNDSDKQTGIANDCFLQTRKPSVFQNHIFETKTSPTFSLYFGSEHACVV